MTDTELIEDLTKHAKALAIKHGLQNSEQVDKLHIRMVLTHLSWRIRELTENSQRKLIP